MQPGLAATRVLWRLDPNTGTGSPHPPHPMLAFTQRLLCVHRTDLSPPQSHLIHTALWGDAETPTGASHCAAGAPGDQDSWKLASYLKLDFELQLGRNKAHLCGCMCVCVSVCVSVCVCVFSCNKMQKWLIRWLGVKANNLNPIPGADKLEGENQKLSCDLCPAWNPPGRSWGVVRCGAPPRIPQ